MKIGLITFTVLELAALVGWMATAATNPILSASILIIGLFLEHIVAFNDFDKVFPNKPSILESLKILFSLKKIPKLKLFLASISEAIVWILWLMVATSNPILGGLILLAGIFLQHNAEINIFIGQPTFKKFLSRRVLGFTLIEVVSGVGWLALIAAGVPVIGAVVLAAGLYFEHIGQGKVLMKAQFAG